MRDLKLMLFTVSGSGPKFHFYADPDPTFYSDADPDPTFQFDADPDPNPTTQFFQIWTLQGSKITL